MLKRNSSTAEKPAPARRPGFVKRLRQKLNRGDSWLTYDLTKLLPGGKINEDTVDELETRLIMGDVGVETTDQIIGYLNRKLMRNELKDIATLNLALRESLLAILEPCSQPLVIDETRKPFVIMVVGVNGSGKTTTIGKLARRYKEQGLQVMLAAGDTFRAAAIEQLQVWGERNDVTVVAQQSGADPAAVVYDALSAAKARGCDVLIADTAGRLHTHSGLMEELKKVKRVLGKLDPEAPHEVLLVLDAGLGQNSLTQAARFNEALGVTGIVMTKLDGTARGGVLLAVADQLKIPLRFIGIGEQAEDFAPFDAHEFVDALLTPEDEDSRPT